MRASGKARRRRHSSAIARRCNAAGGAQARSNAIDISGTVHLAQLNGFPETQTKDAFERTENRFLVVANKLQTGFDQPLLHTMYVDKKLGGVNAVQTLSRLNRTHPTKEDTMVLDFANEAEAIRTAFEPYYEHTILSEGTDPNLLHDLENRIQDYQVLRRRGDDALVTPPPRAIVPPFGRPGSARPQGLLFARRRSITTAPATPGTVPGAAGGTGAPRTPALNTLWD